MKKNYCIALLCLLGLIFPAYAQETIVEWKFDGTYDDTGHPSETGTISATSDSKTRFPLLYPDFSINESGVMSAKGGGYNNVELTLCHTTPVGRHYYRGQATIADYTDGDSHDCYFQFEFSTLGYQDIAVDFSFAIDANTTSTTMRCVYSTDGGTSWIDAGAFTKDEATAGSWWIQSPHTASLPGLKNKENVILRLISGNDSPSANGWASMSQFKVSGVAATGNVQERMIYTTTFQDWEAMGASATVATVEKKTIQGEDLSFSILQASVAPTGANERFSSDVVTPGYIMTQKTNGDTNSTYVELSPLANVTKLSFVQAATGGSRGLTLKVKGDGDADWVSLFNQAISPSQGQLVELDVNRTNVAIRFESFNTAQNGYLLSLDIYGNIEITAQQVKLATAVTPAGAGAVIVSPPGNEYDIHTELTLTAEKQFGYNFLKWTDEAGNELSTANPYIFSIDEDKQITAVFEQVNTYSLTWSADGGANDYLIAVSPAGNVVDGVNYYEEGTDVLVTASGNRIMKFTHWDDNTTAAERTVTMTANTELTAAYSADEFIVAWDFVLDQPASERAADYYADSENQGKFSLRTADGTTSTWLTRGLTNGKTEGRYGMTNWRPIAGKYYYEASFATTGFTNVSIETAMMCAYNAYSVQRVEYSTDGENFTQIGSYTLEAVKTWYDKSFDLPEEAWGKSKVYVRFIPDYSSPLIGTTSDNDGTSMSGVYVLGESTSVSDVVPPVLVSSIPKHDDSGISTSGSIILTFDERIVFGNGSATLNGEELDMTISGKTAIFKYLGLDYNASYTFALPAGVVVDRNGNAYEGTTITFQTLERTQPAARLYDAVVAADGSGDYTTVVDAIAAAPANRVSPWLIFIKEGYYKGHIEIPASKPYIHLIGQDVEKVVITDDRLCGDAGDGQTVYHVSLGASVVVNATNFFAENISFENEWGVKKAGGPQALAMYTNNDRAVFNNCKMRSYQDTYLTSTKANTDRHFLKNCFIEGAVDFIYGGGDVFFDDCVINIVRPSGGYIVAPSHGEGTKWGYVFMNNTITAPTNPASSTSVWLGRPWHNAPKATFINTTAEVTIPAAGWYETMGAIPAIFADYNTMDADGNPIDLSNRRTTYYYIKDKGLPTEETIYGDVEKNTLTPDEAAQHTVKNVLSGEDAWQPHLMTEAIAAPVTITSGNEVSWEAVPYAICYVVSRDGNVVAFTKETSFTDTSDLAGSTITVQAVNEFGGLSAMSTEGIGVAVESTSEETTIRYYVQNGVLHLTNLPEGSRVEFFNFLGQKCVERVADAQLSFELPAGGIVHVRHRGGFESFKVMK